MFLSTWKNTQIVEQFKTSVIPLLTIVFRYSLNQSYQYTCVNKSDYRRHLLKKQRTDFVTFLLNILQDVSSSTVLISKVLKEKAEVSG